MTETAEDGRVARGQRTREAVIDALLDLYQEGNLTPTTEEIAARVGRTSRSIYHHFQDKEALAVAIADRLLEQHRELFTARPPTGTRAERIDGIAAHRAELFETVAPTRRSALVRMHRSPELQRQQTQLATHLRIQLARTFETELSALDPDAADETLELLDLHTSWETWDRLRTWQNLPVERCSRIVIDLVTRALGRR
jgi:TetR/AcrR family transcriptional regulator of autoinduction and epiphytic fitness